MARRGLVLWQHAGNQNRPGHAGVVGEIPAIGRKSTLEFASTTANDHEVVIVKLKKSIDIFKNSF